MCWSIIKHTVHIVRWKGASWDVFWVKWLHDRNHDQIHKQTSPKMDHFGNRYVCNDVILLLTLLRNQPNRFSRCCYEKLILLKWRNKHKKGEQKQGGNSKNPWWDMFLSPLQPCSLANTSPQEDGAIGKKIHRVFNGWLSIKVNRLVTQLKHDFSYSWKGNPAIGGKES